MSARNLVLCSLIAAALTVEARAETQFYVAPGVTYSSNLGEQGVSPAVKGGLAFGNRRFRLESGGSYSTSNKYTGTGWAASGGADALLFLGNNFFLTGGFSYTHRDGGFWTKGAGFAEAGMGVEFPRGSGLKGFNAGRPREVILLSASYARQVVSQNTLNDVMSLNGFFRYDSRLSRRNVTSPWYLRMEAGYQAVDYLNSDGTGPRKRGYAGSFWLGLAYRR